MKIAVFNTGGTISCVGNPLSPMSAQDFAAACQKILNPILLQEFPDLNISYIEPTPGGPGWFPESSSGTLDSTNLQPTDWCIIAQYILSNYSAYDGWVVLHGTDSMDFTGTALPFLMSSFGADGIPTAMLSKPIIITGSQVPLFYQEHSGLTLNFNTDAFQNVCGAVAAAQSGIPEVCIYFQNNLYRGNRTIKTNASEFNAFSSPNYPALAEYGISLAVNQNAILPSPLSFDISLDNPTVLNNTIQQLHYITQNINSFPVMQFNAFPAWYGYNNSTGIISQLISACVGLNIKGLILESYGEGNFPSGCPDTPADGAVYKSLQAANNQGVVIVDCTQVLSGIVNDSAYAAGAWLPSVGALSPADMTPMAALSKLMVLLSAAGYSANNWTTEQVKNLFQLNLLGEMMNVSLLDSRTNSELLTGQSITSLDGSSTLSNDPVLGPVFKNEQTVLWKAFSTPPALSDMPGRLIMQNDGNLVYYSRYNKPMWATNTGVNSGASSMLIIDGSFSQSNLQLKVYNYSDHQITASLYQQSSLNSLITMPNHRRFKFSGRVEPNSLLHATKAEAPDGALIPPAYAQTQWPQNNPVPQYAPTVKGNFTGYNPSGDCNGYYMSYKFQPNNNCYAYATLICPNTFPQPGRNSPGSTPFQQAFTAEIVKNNAVLDGLQFVGTSVQDIQNHQAMQKSSGQLAGHYVALMFSEPESNIGGDPNANWPGDYHWARCDDNVNFASWSQKDGSDQVTNFDFAGQPITNPAYANWRVNQGPIGGPQNDQDEYVVSYDFYCFMYVPQSGVNII